MLISSPAKRGLTASTTASRRQSTSFGLRGSDDFDVESRALRCRIED